MKYLGTKTLVKSYRWLIFVKYVVLVNTSKLKPTKYNLSLLMVILHKIVFKIYA